MKNVHILPTDKPSRLWKNNLLQGILVLNKYALPFNTAQNIYITSSEEIKEGCLDLIKYKNHTLGWYLMIKNNSTVLIKYDGSGLYFNTEITKIFKIILTTDTKLIKDGVQAIDDEFLEWFVKNPSCKEVEVFHQDVYSMGKWDRRYKIIIPKEETKQECECTDECLGYLTKECKRIEEPKIETLEEVAKAKFPFQPLTKVSITRKKREAFIDGAKWQQERSYSEEEVLELLTKAHFVEQNIVEWFERNKKK